MNDYFKKSLKNKMKGVFLTITLIPLIILSIFTIFYLKNNLLELEKQKLNSTLTLKQNQISKTLKDLILETELVADNELFANSIKNINQSVKSISDVEYKNINNYFSKHFNNDLYENIFVISKRLNSIVYEKLNNKITPLSSLGNNKKSIKLGFENLMKNKTTFFTQNENKSLIVLSPIFNKNNDIIGAIAIQISPKLIDTIMNNREGFKNSEKTYLIGNDFEFKNNLEHNSNINFNSNSNILKNKSGNIILKDSSNKNILFFYSNLNLDTNFLTNENWTIVGEIELNEIYKPIYSYSFYIVLFLIVLTIICYILITKYSQSILNPIEYIQNILKKGANGDLTVEIKTTEREDEIGILTNDVKMLFDSLKNQLSNTNKGIVTLAGATSQLSATTTQLASSTTEIAASVSETASSIDEIKQTTLSTSDKAETISKSSEETVNTFKKGQDAVEQTIYYMNKIQEQVLNVSDTIENLKQQAESIGEIVLAVEDIAEQSRLLAVNASIEAVKAGDYGKGFSVVASEIKGLAEQSKKSTNEIRNLLTEIQKATFNAVNITQKSKESVENGVLQSKETGNVIQALNENIEDSSRLTTQIVASIKQQVIGIEQITDAMENVKTAIEQNKEGAVDLKSATESLKELGENLKDSLNKFIS